MRPTIDADGDTWLVRLDDHEAHPGVRAVVFNCVSNSQRPYHVVEVSAQELPGPERLETLPRERLTELFAQSDPLEVVHDPSADPRREGGHLTSPPPQLGERDRG